MAPPGRRRFATTFSASLLSALLLFSPTAYAASAVLGVDLGTEYIKAALVKPGIPLEIVLSKDSKRKETAAVAFKPPRSGSPEPGSFPERLYGGDALALAARFPDEVYPNLKQLLGLQLSNSGVREYGHRYPALELVESAPRGTVAFRSKAFHSGEKSFAVEELLAMELKNVKENAQSLAGRAHKVANAVFTIPSYYTAEERKALDVAAELAGLNILAMMTDGMAVGLNYATSRTFPSVTEGGKPEHHLVLDMGAGSTTATVLRMQGKTVKDVGKYNKTVQEVTVLGNGWDRNLGGDVLNAVIVEDMVSTFLETPSAKKLAKTAADVKTHGRAMARLWKEAERLRQVLSANQQSVASFEDLFQDVDFKYSYSRTEFEKSAGVYADRIDLPIMQALKAANLTFGGIDSVILHGGLTRTPFVQKKLESLVGDASKLRSNVNADEAAVFGAAFKAAQISPSFRVKEIVTNDAASYATYLEWTMDGKKKSQKLFTPTSAIGHTKEVSFKQLEDFTFTLYQPRGSAGANPTDSPQQTYKVKTQNLTATVAQLIEKFGCRAEDISNKFSIRLDPIRGLPDVVRGSISCEVTVEEKKSGVVDGVKGLFGFGGKKDQEPLKDGEDSSSTSSLSPSSSKSSSSSDPKTTASTKDSKSGKATKKDDKLSPPKKKIETMNIEFTSICENCKDISVDEMSRMKTRLDAFDASDKARRDREADLNSLEAFTYKARDYLSDDSFIRFSTAPQRSDVEKLLGETSDWLYGDGVNAAGPALKERLRGLKDLVNPILARKRESSRRPEAIKKLQESLNQTESLAGVVRYSLQKAEEDQASASTSLQSALSAARVLSAEASNSASETPTDATETAVSPSSTSTADPLAELEEDAEPITSSSTTTSPAIPTLEPIFSQYTADDLKVINDLYTETKTWLEAMLISQEKLSETDDPAFQVDDLVARSEKLNSQVMAIFTRQMKIPKAKTFKPPKASRGTKDKKEKKVKSAKSDATESDSGAEKSSATTVSSERQGETPEAKGKSKVKGKGMKSDQKDEL